MAARAPLRTTLTGMAKRHDIPRSIGHVLTVLAAAGVSLAGAAVSAADPAEPPPVPLPADVSAMTPHQPALPPAAAPPAPDAPAPDAPAADAPAPNAPPPPPPHQEVPEIANPNYGSGGGIFGTISDLWQQIQNPYYGADDVPGGGVAPPPGAGPAPQLPPGYVSINAPGSEAPARAPDPSAPRPALPPGYYSLDGPPPPGYEFGAPTTPLG